MPSCSAGLLLLLLLLLLLVLRGLVHHVAGGLGAGAGALWWEQQQPEARGGRSRSRCRSVDADVSRTPEVLPAPGRSGPQQLPFSVLGGRCFLGKLACAEVFRGSVGMPGARQLGTPRHGWRQGSRGTLGGILLLLPFLLLLLLLWFFPFVVVGNMPAVLALEKARCLKA
jgi:hypothetical protein